MRKEIKKQLQTIMDQAVKDNQIAGMNKRTARRKPIFSVAMRIKQMGK